jgi:hypothetical protein
MRERKTLVRKTDNESRRRERYEKCSRCVLGEFCFSLERVGLEEPDLLPFNRKARTTYEIAAYFWWHQQ